MTTLVKSNESSRREQVAGIAERVSSLGVRDVQIRFDDDAYPTTSFVDELILQLVVDDVCESLTFLNADDHLIELGQAAAADYGVDERVRFCSGDIP